MTTDLYLKSKQGKKIYAALLILGPLSLTEIESTTSLKRKEAQEAISDLVSLQLVQESETKIGIVRYFALPAFASTQQLIEKQLSSLKKSTNEYINQLDQNYKNFVHLQNNYHVGISDKVTRTVETLEKERVKITGNILSASTELKSQLSEIQLDTINEIGTSLGGSINETATQLDTPRTAIQKEVNEFNKSLSELENQRKVQFPEIVTDLSNTIRKFSDELFVNISANKERATTQIQHIQERLNEEIVTSKNNSQQFLSEYLNSISKLLTNLETTQNSQTNQIISLINELIAQNLFQNLENIKTEANSLLTSEFTDTKSKLGEVTSELVKESQLAVQGRKKEFNNTIQQISKEFNSSANELLSRVTSLDEDVLSSLTSFNQNLGGQFEAYIDTLSTQSFSGRKRVERDASGYLDQISSALLSRLQTMSERFENQNVEFSNSINQIKTDLDKELEKWESLEGHTKRTFDELLVELIQEGESTYQKLQEHIDERDLAIKEELNNLYSNWDAEIQTIHSNLSREGNEKFITSQKDVIDVFKRTKEENITIRQDIQTTNKTLYTKLEKRFKTSSKELEAINQRVLKNMQKALSAISSTMIEGNELLRTNTTSFLAEMDNNLAIHTSEVQTELRRSLKGRKSHVTENIQTIGSKVEESLDTAMKTIQTVFNDLKQSFNELTTEIGTEFTGFIDEFQGYISKEMKGFENDSGNIVGEFRENFNVTMKEKEEEITKINTSEETRIAEIFQNYSSKQIDSELKRKDAFTLIMNEISENNLKHLENLNNTLSLVESTNEQLLTSFERITEDAANDIQELLPKISKTKNQFQSALETGKEIYTQNIEDLTKAPEKVEKETITKVVDSIYENIRSSASQLNVAVEQIVNTTQNKVTTLSASLDEEIVFQQKEIHETGAQLLEQINKDLEADSESINTTLDKLKSETMTSTEKTTAKLRKALLRELRTLHSTVNVMREQLSPELGKIDSDVSENIESLIQLVEGTYTNAIVQKSAEVLENTKHSIIELYTQLLVQSHESMAETQSQFESSVQELRDVSAQNFQNFSKDAETVGQIYSSSSVGNVHDLRESIQTNLPETLDAVSKLGEVTSSQMNENTAKITEDLKTWVLSAGTQMKTQIGDLKAILTNISKNIDNQISSAQNTIDTESNAILTTLESSMKAFSDNVKVSLSSTTDDISSHLDSSVVTTKDFITSASEELKTSLNGLIKNTEELTEIDKKQIKELIAEYTEKLEETSNTLESFSSEVRDIDLTQKAENRLLSVNDVQQFALTSLFERAQSRIVLALPHPNAIPIGTLMSARPSVRIRVAVNLSDKDVNDWVKKLYTKKVNVTVYNYTKKLPTLVITRDKEELLVSPYDEESSAVALISEQPSLVHFIDNVVLPDLFRKAKRVSRKKS